uniref:Acyltransferase 3 domain-containing protein n=1 Tax=Anopheles farauti TaxID=69004 RepID=A0A182Q2H6_9DIPT
MKVLALIVCSVLCCIELVHCAEEVNMTQYKLMPRVFHFDDYDECLRDDASVPDLYCMVKAVVEPNASSVVWNVIADYSSNWKQHLNHAHLDRGLCLSGCIRLLDELERNNVTERELQSLVVPKFTINFPYILKNGTFRDVDTYRRKYSELFAKCINYELQQKHGLRAYTEIEYCDSNRESYPIDNLEIAFLVVLGVLLLVVVFSSWYDHRCKQDHGLAHYQTELTSKAAMVLVSFSIIRNWYRLTSRGDDSLSRSIRYVHAVRFMIFMMINMGHNILYAQPRTAMVIEKCMQHTWYLAADFHMFVYGLFVCAVVLRYPKYRTYILSFLLLLWSMIAAIIVYENQYEPVTILPPEPLRFFFWYWDMYRETYLPTHMNLVNYTAAIMGSFCLLHLQRKNFQTPKMFSLVWLLGVLAVPGTFAVGYFVYTTLFETPAVWIALVFPLSRIFYTALMFLLSIGFTFRASKPVLRLLNIHLFGILGRLTYCAYLCHFFITRAASFGTRRLANLDVFEMNAICWSTLVMSYVIGWLLCLVLESPFIALQKILFESLRRKRRSDTASDEHLQGNLQKATASIGLGTDALTGKAPKTDVESYASTTEQQRL